MKEQEPFRTIRFEQTLANYQAIAGIVLPALRTALEDLAKHHGSQAGDWLDDLESRLIQSAKGTVTQGVPIEVEAASLKVGIDVLQATLDIVRHSLTTEKDQ